MMKYAPAVSLALSVLLGIAAFLLLRGGNSSEAQPVAGLERAAPAERIRTQDILIVTAELVAGEAVLAEHVSARAWPADMLPEGAVSEISILQNPSFPMIAQAPLFPGEPLLATKIAPTPPRRMLSQDIPDGMRAVSIAVTLETAVAGFVLPGDRVDLTVFEAVPGQTGPDAFEARPLLENVLVLAVDQIMGNTVQGARPSSYVTMALTPDDAQEITAVARQERISLALIGQDEIERREDAEEAAEEPEPAPRPAPPRIIYRTVQAPPPPRPEFTQIRVVHGTSSSTITAPVAPDAASGEETSE